MTPTDAGNLQESLFELAKSRLASADAESIRENIYEYNEWGLAMELLVDALLEDDVSVTTKQKEAIIEAMSAMEITRGERIIRVSD